MGFDLLITEFDVNDREFPADIAKRDASVAAIGKATSTSRSPTRACAR